MAILPIMSMPSFTPLPAPLLEPLPPIVQRYLRMALPHGVPAASRITLEQRGEIRLQEGAQQWRPFTATEQMRVNPPEFVWRARVKLGPLLAARVVDEYLDGVGAIDARLWGVIPLVHPEPNPALDEGALLRYLAEAAWFPMALLPSARLQWQACNTESAVAILCDANTEARLTIHFNSNGEIVHVEALRPYLAGRHYLSRGWSGLFSEWKEFSGMRIPAYGRVFWHIDTGVWEYWRGTIETLTFSDAQ